MPLVRVFGHRKKHHYAATLEVRWANEIVPTLGHDADGVFKN